MYDIYIGNVESEKFELIISLEQKTHEYFFSSLNEEIVSCPYLYQLKDYADTVNYYSPEIAKLQIELESIKIEDSLFFEAIKFACQMSIRSRLDLIFSGED